MSSDFSFFKADGTHGTSSDAGAWNSQGRPDYLTTAEVVDADFVQRVNNSLPEKRPVPTFHPEYLTNTATRNLLITDDGTDVWVTFIAEGAGYRNVFGYYTYPIDLANSVSEPTNLAQIEGTRRVVFPNASLRHKGGQLDAGDRVYLGSFPANTGIGFFVVPNGWNRSTQTIKTSYSTPVYSDAKFNTANEYVQTVLLEDAHADAAGTFVVGFEDIMRSGGDHDFNDLIVRVTASPPENVSMTGVLQTSNGVTYADSRLVSDRSGLYLQFTSDDYTTLTAGQNASSDHYVLTHTITNPDTVAAERMYSYWLNIVAPARQSVTQDGADVTIVHRFTASELKRYLYVLRAIDNQDDETTVSNGMTVYDNMTFLESEYVQANPALAQTVTIERENSSPVVSLTNNDPLDNYLEEVNIWGDPHIATLDGKVYTMPHTEGVFQVYKSRHVDIRAHMLRHAEYHDHECELLRISTFMRYFSVRDTDTGASVVVDLYGLGVSRNGDTDAIHVSPAERVYHDKWQLDAERRTLIVHDGALPITFVLWWIPARGDLLTEFQVTRKPSMWTKAQGLIVSEPSVYETLDEL